ncbi:hypothetical protein CYLTODRAFT_74934 [Cylindrobasidium torrendii FP15055 ss-10]|uniref:Uncharacterized protein n=1 Tax=Cylindrobasidium torrendii FP15055 ss-10 TaxID=1314674 RepID=A0A0D7B4J0_9AGAR|nr:hypothetical protein CYLTODRAFT_74934 [Cylindrobasidium torrendii FP15055 ss-10]
MSSSNPITISDDEVTHFGELPNGDIELNVGDSQTINQLRNRIKHLKKATKNALARAKDAEAEVRVLERRNRETEAELTRVGTTDPQRVTHMAQISQARPLLRCPVCTLTQERPYIHVICLPCLDYCFREQTRTSAFTTAHTTRDTLICPVAACNTHLSRKPTHVDVLHTLAGIFLSRRLQAHFSAQGDPQTFARYSSLQ